MGIVKEPNADSPLSQGDILAQISLFITANVCGKAEPAKVPGELCIVISRPCVLAHKPRFLVAAIDAYEAAKTGKAPAARQTRGARGRPQARRGSKREALMQVIKDNPSGLTRGEILERMGLKGDKSGEMSVSNALTALTKANQVTRRDGRYAAA